MSEGSYFFDVILSRNEVVLFNGNRKQVLDYIETMSEQERQAHHICLGFSLKRVSIEEYLHEEIPKLNGVTDDTEAIQNQLDRGEFPKFY